MARELTKAEWDKINGLFAAHAGDYGLPKRTYGSVVLASFNIRKLGKRRNRSERTWKFLAQVCRHFDLLAIQETMDDLEGFNYLQSLMGPEFHAVVSDCTGHFPGEQGMAERLGFIYNSRLVQRGPIVSDISIDRSKLIKTMIDNYEELQRDLRPYLNYLDEHAAWIKQPSGPEPSPPKVTIPVFLTFVRQPFSASFRIVGHSGTEPYKIMAVNAHLCFGDSIAERRHEFDALMQWILGRVKEKQATEYSNFILLGDLNLDFDHSTRDRTLITNHIKTFNTDMAAADHPAKVYFPFLDAHPNHNERFHTNARLTETFDQIGLFCYDPRLPTIENHGDMGQAGSGVDYGVVNFVRLFSDALNEQPFEQLSAAEKKRFYAKFEHEVSDHMPIWLRLGLPEEGGRE